MNNPLLALAGFVAGCFILPISISIFMYPELEEGEDLPAPPPSKKMINYETVDKESPKISVYNHKENKVENIDLEKYLYGVLSGEMPADFNMEALKAQAVAARTYVLYKENGEPSSAHDGAVVCTDFAHCQEYKSEKELEEIHGKEWMETSYPKIQQAIDETKGQIIAYEEEPILPLYFSTSSGKTENSKEVFVSQYPYLVSVDSPYDNISPKYASTLRISNEDFVSALKKAYSDIKIDIDNLEKEIEVVSKTEGGSVDNIKIGNKTIKGTDVRVLFALNSANFELSFEDKHVNFIVKGYGHGVGMSQWGANGMAEEGYYYYEILKHYYSGTDIKDTY